MNPKNVCENGNVLFIILIAVVLFGALSFAVSNMMRSGDPSDVMREKDALYAAEIIEKARQIREAVQEARLNRSCEIEDISFEHALLPDYVHAPAAPEECQIFHLSSGGVGYSAPPEDWLDADQSAASGFGHWFFTGESCVFEVGNGGADCASANGSSDSDLIAIMPWIPLSLCKAINSALGVTERNVAPPQATGDGWDSTMNEYTGSFSQEGAINSSADDDAILTGVVAGCFEGGGNPPADSYHFYQVLVAR
jgi:hypothetical protein